MVSIIFGKNMRYPNIEQIFSPQERYPEYLLNHFSHEPNNVYSSVRRVFSQSGLDDKDYDTCKWNPLGCYIKSGQKVFVLCNFVYHRRQMETKKNFLGKCIHGSVLRSLVDYILLAIGPKGKVFIGNAPLQSCNWNSVLSDTYADQVIKFYRDRGFPVEPADLRLFVAERSMVGKITNVQKRDDRDGVYVNLGDDSLIAEIDHANARYRVLDYDPRRIESFHRDGRHVYVINRKVLESDVIFSLAKLKTHEKVGITCAIKGCVGAVGHKDCLAHHRFGPPSMGGDEYPSDAFGIRRKLSYFHDYVQQQPLEDKKGRYLRILDRIIRRSIRQLFPIEGGSWAGNDTCYRMAVDLARILFYAKADGKMELKKVRKHLAMIDGIYGGEGNGPLSPRAVNSGLLIFGDNPVASDYAAAILMGYKPEALPIVSKAVRVRQYPLIDEPITNERIFYNRTIIGFKELGKQVSYHYRPPRGWPNLV